LKKTCNQKFNFYFLDQKLQFTFPLASIKDSQATGEAFSPQKRTSSTSKEKKILSFFQFFGVIFALLDPDPDPTAQINADPCGSGSGSGCGSETLVQRDGSD
jgi:hypothetical protein